MNVTGNMRKLTETCNDNNLKLELRMLRQSPLKLNSTNTHRKVLKEVNGKAAKDRMVKKEVVKCNTKVLELLKVGLRRVEDKSKSKSRRFWYLMHLHKILIIRFCLWKNQIMLRIDVISFLKLNCFLVQIILSDSKLYERMIRNLFDDNYNIQM